MFVWEALLNPRAYARGIAVHPPFGQAVLLLLLLAGLWAVTMGCADVFVRRRFEGWRKEWRGCLTASAGVPLLFLLLWGGLTLLTLGIARWLGHPLSFEALFCL